VRCPIFHGRRPSLRENSDNAWSHSSASWREWRRHETESYFLRETGNPTHATPSTHTRTLVVVATLISSSFRTPMVAYEFNTQHMDWRRGSVVRTSLCGLRTFPDLCLIYGWHVTTSWVKRPLWVNQLGQLSLSSFQGRHPRDPCNYMDHGGGDH